jgi:hypothetical protein
MLSPLAPQQIDWVLIEVGELVGTAIVAIGDSTQTCSSPESQISPRRLLGLL